MTKQDYDLWVKHHQAIPKGIDIADATMASITQPKRTVLTCACDACYPYLAHSWIKGLVLVSGAVTGLLRTVCHVYYALFI
jgi:hypothetical protein